MLVKSTLNLGRKEMLGCKLPLRLRSSKLSNTCTSTCRPSYALGRVAMRDGVKGPTSSTSPSFWASKPAWCQPWTILATGSLAIAAVNRISDGSLLWTSLIALPVGAWWLLFLVLVPSAYAQDPDAFASIDASEEDAKSVQR
ncbi:hypothetical protein DUNSADRAFT_5075 [Dunaliella salina]|uniref:DUF6737 domain-containing protein n=1 Tax=Dunaliella salina TaxID=3046 RepID=A0ABQ7HAF8_DUNSA|nr:hypothetical protein DUNSADRAFT_5075 [Dunaliella salina]|eukprot:KAF5843838.1 hypothetical protein DUNSADRAFT_5075 [Dunaliella salina]